MPTSFGVPGFNIPMHERFNMLVGMVGGPTRAAQIIGRTRTTIDNWRKPGATLPIEDMLKLAVEARVSLDWVATGYQVRPDLAADPVDSGFERLPGVVRMLPAPAGVAEPGSGFDGAGFIRLLPVRPEVAVQSGASVERWVPSPLAVSAVWLDSRLGLGPETARYAIVDDAAMEPRLGRGALVIVDIRPAAPRSGIYLVGVGEELLARRLNRMPGGGSELVADAEPAWRYPVPAEPGAGFILHRIVWAGQDL